MNRMIPILGLLSFVAWTAPVPAQAQTSYPLVCRGGGGMSATLTAAGSIRLHFQPGTAAASATPPGAGACTWLDRGFRSGEPAVLRLEGDPGGVRYLIDGMLGGGSFYAHAYTDGAGAMRVTRIGP